VKVKLGPINLTYKGKAAFIEKDEAARRAVIDARGRDARGNGTATAKITATLHDDGGNSTTVEVITDLDITGKPAQFGRGVMVDVGNKLLGQFADALAKTIRGDDVQAPAVATAPASADAAAGVAAAAPAEALPETPADGDDDLTPDYSAPGDMAVDDPAQLASVNGSTPAPPRRSHDDIEPIDLLHSAGPAIAKRLAPIAVAIVVVLIAVRRYRRSD
jgi:hypothetical protein